VPTVAQEFLSPEAAGWLTTILRGVERPSGFLAQRFAEKQHRIAFKTGTSYGFRDAVAIGFSARHTVAAWVGRPDGASHDNFIGLDTARLMLRGFDLLRDNTPQAEEEGLKERVFGDAPAALARYPAPAVGAAIGQSKHFRILFPPQDAMISTGKNSPVILEADAGRRPYIWLVNGAPLGQSRLSGRLPWQPSGAGAYRITAIDATGAHDSVEVWLQRH
jgi:penicillin-binding protein 1C